MSWADGYSVTLYLPPDCDSRVFLKTSIERVLMCPSGVSNGNLISIAWAKAGPVPASAKPASANKVVSRDAVVCIPFSPLKLCELPSPHKTTVWPRLSNP